MRPVGSNTPADRSPASRTAVEQAAALAGRGMGLDRLLRVARRAADRGAHSDRPGEDLDFDAGHRAAEDLGIALLEQLAQQRRVVDAERAQRQVDGDLVALADI